MSLFPRPSPHPSQHLPHKHVHAPVHAHFHHITIDGTGTKSYPAPATYENAVVSLLRNIHKSHTGAAVFEEFELRSHHLMKIIPLENVLNAFASGDDYDRASERGRAERSGADGSLLKNAAGHNIIGKGGGSNSTVSFNPLTWTNYCSQQKKGHKCGAHPDEILFHEMIHATRQMRGIFNPLPLGFLYDTEEEFYAILIANMYASETGRKIDIRADHHTFNHMVTDTNELFLPKKDAADYRYRLIAKFVQKEARLAAGLARLKHVPFNPVRRYFELQHTHVSMHH